MDHDYKTDAEYDKWYDERKARLINLPLSELLKFYKDHYEVKEVDEIVEYVDDTIKAEKNIFERIDLISEEAVPGLMRIIRTNILDNNLDIERS